MPGYNIVSTRRGEIRFISNKILGHPVESAIKKTMNGDSHILSGIFFYPMMYGFNNSSECIDLIFVNQFLHLD